MPSNYVELRHLRSLCLLVLVTLPGCQDDPPRCLTDGDCAAGRACVDARCEPVVDAGCAARGVDDTCDGVDDDCDGTTDEAWQGEARCGLGPCAAEATAARCVDGVLTPCQPGPGTAEACNGVDDDCDGAVDEVFDLDQDVAHCGGCDRPCAPDDAVPFCRDGVCGIAACAAGFSDCNGSAGDGCETAGVCPPDGQCDGTDDDHDGRVDEDYVSDASCGAGRCRAENTPSRCVEGRVTACAPGAPVGGDDACDGVDDDCDGRVDEGAGVGAACAVGVGACQRGGRVVCGADGTPRCDAEAGAPLADDGCDGVDADCDGRVDEGYVAPDPAGCGAVGACAAEARAGACVDGAVAACTPGAPSDEVCNAIDDDCDGIHDEQALAGFGSVYVPFAAQAVGAARRASWANMAWSGESLALVWQEYAPAAYEESAGKVGGITVVDAEGRAVSDDLPRLLAEEDVAPPQVAWDGARLVVVWTRASNSRMRALLVADDGEVLGPVTDAFVDPSGHIRAVLAGPFGALIGWYREEDVWTGTLRPDGSGEREQLSVSAESDRGPRMALGPDRVGVVWHRRTAEGVELRMRVVDRRGQPLSDEVAIGDLGVPRAIEDRDTWPTTTSAYDIAWNGRGFVVTWAADDGGVWRLQSRRVSASGAPIGEPRAWVRPGRIESRTFPAQWVPALQSTVVAWSELTEGRPRVWVGLLDPISGALAQAWPVPEGEGAQLNPSDVAWLGDRLAVVWEEKRGEDDWRLALGIGSVGCGRSRCREGALGGGDATCDGIDDDCDGAVDESHAPELRCGVGACAERATAGSACADGFATACLPGDPEPETCNGADDDCDGAVDEPAVAAASRFDRDAEGWRVVEMGPVDNPNNLGAEEAATWAVEAGLGGGYLTHTDDAATNFHFSAPARLLGDRSDLVGGALRFLMRSDRADIERPSGVVLYGGDGTWLRHSIDRAVFAGGLDEWHAVVVPLVPDAFTGADGMPASPATLRAVLGGLQRLLISGEWGATPQETTHLDDVEWLTPACR